jgi:hypothetical protein
MTFPQSHPSSPPPKIFPKQPIQSSPVHTAKPHAMPYNATFLTLFANPSAPSLDPPPRLIGRSFNASIIVSSDIQPVSSRKSQKKSAKPGLSLHNRSSLQHVEVLHLLQDCFKSGPTWRVHQLRAERGVFGGRDAAEEREFVLLRRSGQMG